ncbi:hypothetical protein WN51_01136 [Melipona quadrifasciata]|uniref:Uncharacterized protein n=1 Tax=Melipona quadrifasciata TaxID=166423 RepID=A0A0M9A0F1_9HYME|nr:hypothetical protein WN51_01136 [Melipona quadrifasciata]
MKENAFRGLWEIEGDAGRFKQKVTTLHRLNAYVLFSQNDGSSNADSIISSYVQNKCGFFRVYGKCKGAEI